MYFDDVQTQELKKKSFKNFSFWALEDTRICAEEVKVKIVEEVVQHLQHLHTTFQLCNFKAAEKTGLRDDVCDLRRDLKNELEIVVFNSPSGTC